MYQKIVKIHLINIYNNSSIIWTINNSMHVISKIHNNNHNIECGIKKGYPKPKNPHVIV